MRGAYLTNGFAGGRFMAESILLLQIAAEKYLTDYFAMAYVP